MKAKYKYIEFVQDGEFQNRPQYNCLNIKDTQVLGMVCYYVPWKQFIITPDPYPGIVFSSDCLDDISDFLNQLNKTGKYGR